MTRDDLTIRIAEAFGSTFVRAEYDEWSEAWMVVTLETFSLTSVGPRAIDVVRAASAGVRVWVCHGPSDDEMLFRCLTCERARIAVPLTRR